MPHNLSAIGKCPKFGKVRKLLPLLRKHFHTQRIPLKNMLEQVLDHVFHHLKRIAVAVERERLVSDIIVFPKTRTGDDA